MIIMYYSRVELIKLYRTQTTNTNNRPTHHTRLQVVGFGDSSASLTSHVKWYILGLIALNLCLYVRFLAQIKHLHKIKRLNLIF